MDPLGELVGKIHDRSSPELINVLSDGQKLVPSGSPHVDVSLTIPLGLLVPGVQGPNEIFIPYLGILRLGHGGCVRLVREIIVMISIRLQDVAEFRDDHVGRRCFLYGIWNLCDHGLQLRTSSLTG